MMDGWKRTEHIAGPGSLSHSLCTATGRRALPKSHLTLLGTVWLADNAMEIPQISVRAQVQDLVLSLWEPFASSPPMPWLVSFP